MKGPSTFGRRLRLARALRQFSQSELATRSRVNKMMISQYETGIRPGPTAVTLVRLSRALDVSSDYLLGLTTEQPT